MSDERTARLAETVATLAMRVLGDIAECTCHLEGQDFDCWFRYTPDEQAKALAHALQIDPDFLAALDAPPTTEPTA